MVARIRSTEGMNEISHWQKPDTAARASWHGHPFQLTRPVSGPLKTTPWDFERQRPNTASHVNWHGSCQAYGFENFWTMYGPHPSLKLNNHPLHPLNPFQESDFIHSPLIISHKSHILHHLSLKNPYIPLKPHQKASSFTTTTNPNHKLPSWILLHFSLSSHLRCPFFLIPI